MVRLLNWRHLDVSDVPAFYPRIFNHLFHRLIISFILAGGDNAPRRTDGIMRRPADRYLNCGGVSTNFIAHEQAYQVSRGRRWQCTFIAARPRRRADRRIHIRPSTAIIRGVAVIRFSRQSDTAIDSRARCRFPRYDKFAFPDERGGSDVYR